MKTIPHLEAVLFDVDGTLIDSNRAHARSWTEALAASGVRVREGDVLRLIGTGGDKLLDAIAGIDEDSDLGKRIVAAKKARFAELLPSLTPVRGARALLEYLERRRVRLVVATSGDDRDVAALLAQAGLDDLLPSRASKDDASKSKPDPDIVRAALQKSGASCDEAVLIGDTPYDIEAGRRAGIEVIAVRCGGTWSDDGLTGASLIVDDPAALLAQWRGEELRSGVMPALGHRGRARKRIPSR